MDVMMGEEHDEEIRKKGAYRVASVYGKAID